jgi:hypothetical protein
MFASLTRAFISKAMSFSDWGNAVAARSGYAVRFLSVGDEDAEVGAPTQMAVFSR